MPNISAFFGIIIRMFYNEHGVPHFHAVYAECSIKIVIESGDVIIGYMPKRALKLIQEWRILHIDELNREWELARDGKELFKIDALE